MSQGGRQEPGRGNGYGDDYAEDDDEYYTYDATDEEDEGRRRPIVILAIVALIVIFAVVVFLAYKQGLRQGALDNPPIIRADNSPTKEAPVNPGGMQIPHQDRDVYNRLSGSGEPEADDAEHLLPKAEEPLAMDTPPATQPPITVPVAPQAASVEPAPVSPVISSAPTNLAAPVNVPKVAETVAPAAIAPVASSTAGGYVVQLAAFRDEPSARDAFRKLQGKYPSLAALGADIQRADLGDKGIYYRLRAGYLSKADAQTLCGELEGKGQACFVRTK
tara:strand:+ start:547 stop:1374 length:828 start_codon:yes stop_codon:yes gene_type:complete